MNDTTKTFQEAVDEINEGVNPTYKLRLVEASITDGIPTYRFRVYNVDHTPHEIKFHNRSDASAFLTMFAIAQLSGVDSIVNRSTSNRKQSFFERLFS